jgi:hypothetical protein
MSAVVIDGFAVAASFARGSRVRRRSQVFGHSSVSRRRSRRGRPRFGLLRHRKEKALAKSVWPTGASAFRRNVRVRAAGRPRET